MAVSSGHEARLEETEFFRSLAPPWLEQVRSQVRERWYPARKVLFREGEAGEFLWAVRVGEVRIIRTTRDGRVMALETIRPGQIFGVVAAMEGNAYPVTAETAVESCVWRLPRVALLSLIRNDPQLTRVVLQIVSQRLRGAHTRLRSLAYDPADARLAQALLRSAAGDEAHVTRRELAEAAGTTIETAIRVLRRFEQAGFVKGEVHHVHILDRDRLRQVAHEEPEEPVR
ncbi:Cyclic AMP receptor protein [Myxococcaceae bacterium]|nr:Cyclic AMP receptor protein [Myxococcaceae bacterium]